MVSVEREKNEMLRPAVEKPIRQAVRKPLYQQAREILLERIRSGEWAPGDQIPTEPVLAKELGISIGTLRRAVEMLVSEAILDRREGAGTFLRTYREAGYWNRFQIFRPTDGSLRRYDARFVVFFERAPALGRVASSLSVPEGTPAVHFIRHFTKRLQEDDNHLMSVDEIWLPEALFPGMTRETLRERLHFEDSLYKFYDREFGVIVTSQKASIEYQRIGEEEARRLGTPPGWEVLTAWRVSMTYGRKPVELRIHRFEATSVRIELDIE